MLGCVMVHAYARGGVATILFDLGFSIVAGSSAAWASGRLLTQESWWRSTGLWALVLFEVTLFVPAALYLSWSFPGWRLFGWQGASAPTAVLLSAVGPGIAVGVFVATRRLLLLRRRLLAAGVVALGLVLLSIVLADAFGYMDLSSGGLPRGRERQGAYLGGGAALAILAGWSVCVWRTRLLSVSSRSKPAVAAGPVPVRDGGTKPLQKAKKAAKEGR